MLDLSTQMVERGHQVRVVTPHAPGSARFEVLNGVEVSRYRYLWPASAQTLSNQAVHAALNASWLARLKVAPFLGMLLLNIQREIIRFKPDLIHCHWLIPQGAFCAALGKLNRVPVLVSMHGSDVFCYRSKLIDAVRRWTLRNVELGVANSSAVLRRVAEINRAEPANLQTPTIPMGVDTTLFHPALHSEQVRDSLGANEGPLLLSVGRLSPEKGHRYLLEALPHILRRFPKARLAIVGYGPCEAELKEQAEQLNLNHAIHWLGPRRGSDLAELYASADVFVSPSIRTSSGVEEALGLVFLEAMASGTVPVGSSIGGIPDAIHHGENGALAREKDPVDLAEKVCWVLEDAGRREKMSAAAIETARRRFSWDSIGDRYDALYSKIAVAKAA